jgi:phage terminase large subunit
MMYFDAKKCASGLEALSNYHEKWDQLRDVGLGPNHNWASHGSDAFGLMCIAYEEPRAGTVQAITVTRALPEYRT